MKHLLIYFTKTLHLNPLFKELVEERLKEYRLYVNEYVVLDVNTANLDFFINLQDSKYTHISIITEENSFCIVNKFLATMNESELIQSDDDFILKDNLKYQNFSLLIKLNDKFVNILKAKDYFLPEFLYEDSMMNVFYIVDNDFDGVNVILNTQAKPYGVKVFAFNLVDGLICVNVFKEKFSHLDGFMQSVRVLFDKKIIEEISVFSFILNKLKEKNKTITFAESCTAGALVNEFSRLDGCSNILMASVITYSINSKKQWLKIDDYCANNVYSNECAIAMAKGALALTKADYAISTTGLLGKADFNEIKSGDVFICVTNNEKNISKKLKLNSSRILMQKECALACAALLLEFDKELFFSE